MLSAVAEIGDSLGLNTVAEGIETAAQLERLRALHYTYGQGCLFSKPVPADEVEKLIADGVTELPTVGYWVGSRYLPKEKD